MPFSVDLHQVTFRGGKDSVVTEPLQRSDGLLGPFDDSEGVEIVVHKVDVLISSNDSLDSLSVI